MDRAYNWANQELINIVIEEKDLIGRLKSMKKYFFLHAGDFLVHFLDGCLDELDKELPQISQEKLQSLLEMSIRTSSADKDPYKEDVHCFLNQEQNLQILLHYVEYQSPENYQKLMSYTSPYNARNNNTPSNNKGYFYFTLGYDVAWPLNIIISLKTMLKYQILFRNIFQAKLIERMLSQCWKSHQDLKDLEAVNLLKPGYGILQRMIHFVKNYIYFLCHEVVEIKWNKFLKNMEHVSFTLPNFIS